MYDLIIIGGGPAALSAAVYALGKQLDFLVIYGDPGGKAGVRQQLTGQVDEEYLAGAEAVLLFERRITMQAGRTLRDRVIEVSKSGGVFHVATQNHGIEQGAAVIVATGAAPIMLDVPGARDLLGQGLGYSVTTHTNLLAHKTAAVIGTTVRALRGVAELSRIAARVYLVAPDATGMATPLARALRQRPNVEVFEGYDLREVVGSSSVEELVLAREDETHRLQVDAAFVDLGLLPNSVMVRQIVQTDQDGFIWVDDRNATTQPGLFAAGDVTTAFGEQILIAIGEGARAALSAYDYLLARPAAQEP
jgi:thioredoxin reductase